MYFLNPTGRCRSALMAETVYLNFCTVLLR
jgi:hypothetical protein